VRGRLTPNQTIKIVLPGEEAPIACSGTIVWARLEAPSGGRPLRYHAGVQFVKPHEGALEAFIARHALS
jgi:hypothetical protein